MMEVMKYDESIRYCFAPCGLRFSHIFCFKESRSEAKGLFYVSSDPLKLYSSRVAFYTPRSGSKTRAYQLTLEQFVSRTHTYTQCSRGTKKMKECFCVKKERPERKNRNLN